MTRSGPTGRTAARLCWVLVAAALSLVLGAGPAAAHNVLRSVSPTSGSTVSRTPSAVVLTFDQPAIAMGTELTVTGPSGAVQAGRPRLVDNTVTQDLQGGAPAGTYTVLWRVTSADGHPVSGTFTFTSREVGTGSPEPVPPSEPAATTPPVPRSVVIIAGAVAAAGVVTVIITANRRRRRIPS